eukprot:TRINITY_DN5150_c0_g1_i1.p1 TRINITY_DN5150_c0_g1~~TRINITY_DN5150_c0_g1_i1.p1  ORF type:complete len:485 (+),score=133.74 TRINITY_DN5150_c0_g1_i1:68-1456(+)
MAAVPAARTPAGPSCFLPPWRRAAGAQAAPSPATAGATPDAAGGGWQSAIDVTSVAREFPQVTPGQVYLDSAATTLKPGCVVDAMSRFYRLQYASVHRGMYPQALKATDRYHGAREKVQRLLNARTPEEVVFTRGCTEGINFVARSFGDRFVSEGDEVVVSESEHHSNLVPWQMLCARKKARLRVIPVTADGSIDTDALGKVLSDRTRIVAIQHRSNVTGVTHPVEQIAQLARAKGARVLLDAAQSCLDPGLDVSKLGVDFVTFSGHKMFGPTGIGVLWGRREVMEQLPPPQGGGDMVDHVDWARTTFAPLPQRWEAGTPPIAEAIGLGAACDWVTKIGRSQLHAYLNGLGEYARGVIRGVPGVHMLPGRGNVVAFTVPGQSPLDAATLLGASGFAVRAGHHCCQPLHRRLGTPSSVRVSVGPWNSKKDIDAFAASLRAVLARLSAAGAPRAQSTKAQPGGP